MKKPVSIIGIGALGNTLACALDLQGYEIHSLFNRTVSKADKLGAKLNARVTGSLPETHSELGDITFITVSDDAIAPIADKLADELWDFSGKTVAHCSGNETSDILDPFAEAGADIAAFHPLQTFNLNSDPGTFRNIYISLEGQDEAINELEEVVARMGAHPLHVTPGAKSYLHAAAVVASNYLVTLMQLSGDIAELGGIDHQEARKALQPLVKTTVDNSTDEDLSSVLSGPIARGDLDTVKKHVRLLEQNPQLTSLYKWLGLQTTELAKKKGGLTDEKIARLQKILMD